MLTYPQLINSFCGDGEVKGQQYGLLCLLVQQFVLRYMINMPINLINVYGCEEERCLFLPRPTEDQRLISQGSELPLYASD